MKIFSGGEEFVYDTETLSKPTPKLKKLINNNLKKFTDKVNFYVVNQNPEPFAGCAFYGEDSTYSICLSGQILHKPKHYIDWVIKHELRHCKPTKNTPFRYHDVELYDIGFMIPRKIGFFYEDFEDIANDDILKLAFCNIYKLGEYI